MISTGSEAAKYIVSRNAVMSELGIDIRLTGRLDRGEELNMVVEYQEWKVAGVSGRYFTSIM